MRAPGHNFGLRSHEKATRWIEANHAEIRRTSRMAIRDVTQSGRSLYVFRPTTEIKPILEDEDYKINAGIDQATKIKVIADSVGDKLIKATRLATAKNIRRTFRELADSSVFTAQEAIVEHSIDGYFLSLVPDEESANSIDFDARSIFKALSAIIPQDFDPYVPQRIGSYFSQSTAGKALTIVNERIEQNMLTVTTGNLSSMWGYKA